MKGWKTLAFMSSVAVVGVLQQADWASLIPSQYAGAAVAVIGGIGFALRMVTSTPPGRQ